MHVSSRARRRAGVAPLAAALAAAAMAAGAPAAVAARTPVATGTIYGGYTSQDAPMMVTLTPDHRRLRSIDAYVSAKCDDGKPLTYNGVATFVPEMPPTFTDGDDVLVGGRLPSGGKVTAKGAGAEDYGATLDAAFVQTLKAKVRGNRASGT